MQYKELIEFSFWCGVAAYTFCFQFVAPGKIFDGWTVFVNTLTNNLGKELRSKLRLVLYGCESCIAGQIALWTNLMFPTSIEFALKSIALSMIIAAFLGKYLTRT